LAGSGEIELSTEERKAIQRLNDLAASGNYYALLGVSRLADTNHVRRAYYDLSRQWHPDRFYRKSIGFYKEMLDSVFVSITKAYSVLTDAARREEYDRENGELLDRTANLSHLDEPGPEDEDEPPEEAAIYEVARSWFKAPEKNASAVTSSKRTTPTESHLTRKRKMPVPGVEKVRQQIKEMVTKARMHHDEAVAAAADGNWVKAQSAIYLSQRYVPTNPLYKKLHDEYAPKARQQLAQQAIQAAEAAEGYHNVKGAAQHYERACAFDPPIGLPFFRLAMIKRADEEIDEKEIQRLFRVAVEKEPSNVKYRMALAEYYYAQGNKAAARREYQMVLRVQPNHAEAKAGIKKT